MDQKILVEKFPVTVIIMERVVHLVEDGNYQSVVLQTPATRVWLSIRSIRISII